MNKISTTVFGLFLASSLIFQTHVEAALIRRYDDLQPAASEDPQPLIAKDLPRLRSAFQSLDLLTLLRPVVLGDAPNALVQHASGGGRRRTTAPAGSEVDVHSNGEVATVRHEKEPAKPHGSELREGEGHSEEEAAPGEEKEEMAYALCLMGSVAVIMSLFYLVNSPRAEIAASTWKALNMTISIFVAVLIFGMIHEIIKGLLEISPDVGITKMLSVWVFIFTYLAFQTSLFVCMYMDKGSPLRATGTIFAHLTGFSAMYLTAEIQFEHPIRHSPWLMLMVAVGTGFVLITLCWLSSKVRQACADYDGQVDAEEELWQDVVNDAEKDMLSLAWGFALMQAMRKFITGHAQAFEPKEAPREDLTQTQVDLLLLCSAIFAILVVLGGGLCELLSGNMKKHSLGLRFLEALPSTASMAMAWSLLFWGEWQIYVLGFEGIRIAGCILVAITMTGIAVILVFVLDFMRSLQSRKSAGIAIRELVLALGLMVGFTWERAFDMGLEVLSESRGQGAYFAKHFLPLIFVLIVLPAWSVYVLPKAVDE